MEAELGRADARMGTEQRLGAGGVAGEPERRVGARGSCSGPGVRGDGEEELVLLGAAGDLRRSRARPEAARRRVGHASGGMVAKAEQWQMAGGRVRRRERRAEAAAGHRQGSR